MFRRTFIITAMISLATLTGAHAQTAVQPNRTTANYGDWLTRCESVKNGSDLVKSCEMAQTFAGGNGQGNIAQLIIGRPQGDKADRIFIELPAGIWLPDGVLLKVADKDLATLTFKRCVQSCFAGTVLADTQRETLFSATSATLMFKDATQKPVVLSLSLKGIRDAYKAMNEK